MCTHPRSSLFGMTPGPRPIHDRPRSSRRFRTIAVCVSRPFAFLYFSFGSGSSRIRPRILFAYFVLRTRRIRSSHFRHVCLCSSTRSRIDGDVDATRFRTYLSGSTKKSTAFLHVREFIYDSVCTKSYVCVTRKRVEAGETVSTVPYISRVKIIHLGR